MQQRPKFVNRLAQPIKSLAQRFAFMGLLMAAVGMMILGKVDVLLMDSIRAQVTDTVAPILDALSRPIDSVSKAVDPVRELARNLEAENKFLKGLLNYVPGPEHSFITGRVIADTGGAFAHGLILNAGARDGVVKGQAAITGDGLIGRVSGVGDRSARILLITDLNSRIPVLVGSDRTRAILAGNNSDHPRLIPMASGETVLAGDRIITSGHGGAFPPGLPVGKVASVNDGGISVQPFVRPDRLEVVRLLNFELAEILPLPKPGADPKSNSKAGDHKGARARKP